MTSLAVLRDGRLASGGDYEDMTIRIWDLARSALHRAIHILSQGSGVCDRVLKGHTSVSESDVFVYCLYMGECCIVYS